MKLLPEAGAQKCRMERTWPSGHQGWGVGRQRARATPRWPLKPCSAGYELSLCSQVPPCGLAGITYPRIPCSPDCCPGGWHVLPLASFLTQSPPWSLELPAPARDRSCRQNLVDIWGCCQRAGKPAGDWHLAPLTSRPGLQPLATGCVIAAAAHLSEPQGSPHRAAKMTT